MSPLKIDAEEVVKAMYELYEPVRSAHSIGRRMARD